VLLVVQNLRLNVFLVLVATCGVSPPFLHSAKKVKWKRSGSCWRGGIGQRYKLRRKKETLKIKMKIRNNFNERKGKTAPKKQETSQGFSFSFFNSVM
jgi:hypothetical protein